MPNNGCNRARRPAARSCSLPLMPSKARLEEPPRQPQGNASGRCRRQEPIPAPAKAGKGGSAVGGAPPVSMAWGEGTGTGDGLLPGEGGGEGGGGESARGGRKKIEGRAVGGRTAFPRVAAPGASGELVVQLLSVVAPTGKGAAATAATATSATPVPDDDDASASTQANPKARRLALPRKPATEAAAAAAAPRASKPAQQIGEASAPLFAVPSPTRPPAPEPPGPSPTRAAPPAVAAGTDRNPHPMSPHRHKSPRSGSLSALVMPTALGERAKSGGICDPGGNGRNSFGAEASESLDSLSATCSAGGSQKTEEIWEAFYFYHSGGVKVGCKAFGSRNP